MKEKKDLIHIKIQRNASMPKKASKSNVKKCQVAYQASKIKRGYYFVPLQAGYVDIPEVGPCL